MEGYQRFIGQDNVNVINSNYIYIEDCNGSIYLLNCNEIRIKDSKASISLINCNDVIMENCTGKLEQINCNGIVSQNGASTTSKDRRKTEESNSNQNWTDRCAVKFEELMQLLLWLKRSLEEQASFREQLYNVKVEIDGIKKNAQVIARDSANKVIDGVRRILTIIKNISFVAMIVGKLMGWLSSLSLP